MNGFMVSYSADMIEHDISNIQVHNPAFKNDFDINYYLADATKKASELRSSEGVVGVTTRMITNGMVSSPQKAGGVQIRGIDLKMKPSSQELIPCLPKGLISKM